MARVPAHDAPRRDGADRYAIYAVAPRQPGVAERERRRLCETSSEGVTQGIELMIEEGNVPKGWAIGVLDRLTRAWTVNPYA